MYRVIAIIGGALTLAACSTSDFGNFGNLDAFKPAPMMDTVSFETDPPGADVKVSNGQTCKSPCSLALPVDQPLTVTFSLAGYETESESISPLAVTGAPPRLNPNPVTAELTRATAKPAAKKSPAKKPAPKKPAKKPAPKAASTPAPAPAPAAPPTFAPAPAQSSPWPAPPR